MNLFHTTSLITFLSIGLSIAAESNEDREIQKLYGALSQYGTYAAPRASELCQLSKPDRIIALTQELEIQNLKKQLAVYGSYAAPAALELSCLSRAERLNCHKEALQIAELSKTISGQYRHFLPTDSELAHKSNAEKIEMLTHIIEIQGLKKEIETIHYFYLPDISELFGKSRAEIGIIYKEAKQLAEVSQKFEAKFHRSPSSADTLGCRTRTEKIKDLSDMVNGR